MRFGPLVLMTAAACGSTGGPKAGVVPDALADGWSVGLPADVQLDGRGIAELERRIDAGEVARPDSMLVIRHGVLVYERYFDGDRETRYDLRSATKSITSLLVGIAQDKGLLTVDTTVTERLPRYAEALGTDDRKSQITVRHLLQMRSGLNCDDWDRKSPGNEERMYDSSDWVEFVTQLGMRAEPGSEARYCTGGVVLLGAMLGNDVVTLAREWLFAPLGIERADWQKAAGGHIDTGGHLRLRARDFAKIGQLVLNRGVWSGLLQVVSSHWLDDALADGGALGDSKYGYLWWRNFYQVNDVRTDVVFARGNGGQLLLVMPSLDMVVVFTSAHYNDAAQDEPLAWTGQYIVPAAH
ncbi:MAG: serine hydrolase [Clostridia bacterium]|nr:serine hydrolase [Deltaproteobacteria bacterium]